MLTDPRKINKYLYVEKTPTSAVVSVYIFGIFSWLLVIYGFSGLVIHDQFFQLIVAPVLLLFSIYHFISFGINLFYRQFDLKKHLVLVKRYWLKKEKRSPSVDIFLPICGEDLEVLNNTWYFVSHLKYKNKKVYVLDDSKDLCEEHRRLAEFYGFIYISRPNKGEMKKAGNLKYAYQRTNGEFITIFDADFAPHPDFLKELLPYTKDPNVGIVQSPQYFEISEKVYQKTPLAYAASFQEEIFYRVMQVAKDRFNAAICCGSNAIYRRVALDAIGGPRQVDASEDSRTGFAMLNQGYATRYIPILLALGICPDNSYAYFHQQHRWCRGRSELVLSKEFLKARVPLMTKICNLSGFLSFLSQPLGILLSFQLFWSLIFYNEWISFYNSIFFYPYMAFSLFLLPIFHLARFKKEVFYTGLLRTYASTHALIGVFLGKSVAWIPTNAKHVSYSAAFRQTTMIVAIYVVLYTALATLSFRVGALHLLTFRYYSIQFWIIWNMAFSVTLLWCFYQTMRNMRKQQVSSGVISKPIYVFWQLRTAGFYLVLLSAIVFGINLL